MATFTITNLTNDPVSLQEAYVTVPPNGTLELKRFLPRAEEMDALFALRDAGTISWTVLVDAWEWEFRSAPGATRVRHESITPSEYGSRAPGPQPDPVVYGTIFALEFTPNADTAYRVFKIPAYYVGDASFHVHWTKSDGGVDESGNAVRWRISYTVFPGSGSDANATPTVLEVEDVYDDGGSGGSQIIYRTGDLAASGFVANYYVGVCIEAITPTGSALVNDPALVSMDLVWTEEINR